jgi:SNF2 family DNA or RNA helicase
MQLKLFNEDGGKGGRLTGTVTDDMLDSSKSVLESYRGRGTRGLQQFFSPPECAELVHKVFKDVAVVDLTAGNGALISKFTNRFGIEIDPDQAKSGYRAIVGDLQKVYPLLRKVGFKTDAIAINPPFGLQWNDAKYGSLNSTVLCYLYAVSLLNEFGQGVLIAGADRFDREILTRDEGNFYAVIECDDLFTDADIPSVVAFFTDKPCSELHRWHSDKADLPSQADEVVRLRVRVKSYISSFTSDIHLEYMNELWNAIQHEYDNRHEHISHQYSISSKNNKIAVRLSAYDKLALQKDNKLSNVTSLNNQSINYFALNQREWNNLMALEDDGLITIDPSLKDTVRELLIEAEKQICPLYPIKPQQRLGFLEHLDSIECYQSDAEFTAGQSYPVSAQSQIMSSQYTEPKLNKDGELVDVNKLKEWKVLEIKIGGHEFSESPQDIQYIIDHFKLPDPGDVASRFPDDMSAMFSILDRIESQYGNGNWKFRQFQRDDIARILLKGGGLLSWEQGLGKTLGGLAFAQACIELGADDKALFIVPQDLVPQWQREAQRFLGKELTVIRDIIQAKEVKDHLRNDGTGWYITYYEALSRNGRAFELLPHKLYKHPNPKYSDKVYDRIRDEYVDSPRYIELDSSEFCPQCAEPAQYGKWYVGRGICGSCGYRHIKLKVKPAYSHLTTAFKHGIVIIDEGTKIKSNDSLMSLSVRGIRARYKLLLTGTPIKNYIPDAYWLLWWALGNRSIKFPFDYQGGYMKFTKEFAVSEYTLDEWGSKKGAGRVLPEVTNLSVLWRLLCSSIIRRRKEETGEPMVSRKLVPVICPLGEEQARMYSDWLSGFTDYFIATHNTPICDYPNLVERSSAILGQLWKLEFSSVLPQAEPDGYYPRGSNWTPANLKVLELAMEHARSGDKVLIGSSLMAYGPWIATQLLSAGVNVIHITEESNGKYQTKSPAKRASLVDRFRNDGANVLCASIHSMQLGHNLDTANVVILRGLPWDYSTFDQFIARVHRLTSRSPVTVYIVMSEGTVDIRKWELLNQKGAASQLALDGTLFHQDTEQIDLQQILDELKRRGISSDSTIPEEQIHQQWRSSAIKPIIPATSKLANDMLTDDDWSTVDTSIAIQLTLF